MKQITLNVSDADIHLIIEALEHIIECNDEFDDDETNFDAENESMRDIIEQLKAHL